MNKLFILFISLMKKTYFFFFAKLLYKILQFFYNLDEHILNVITLQNNAVLFLFSEKGTESVRFLKDVESISGIMKTNSVKPEKRIKSSPL